MSDKIQQIPINIEDTTPVECDSCKNQTFVDVVLLRRVSAIMSPTGKAALIPIQAMACNACGHINAEFLPKLPSKSDTPAAETSKDQSNTIKLM